MKKLLQVIYFAGVFVYLYLSSTINRLVERIYSMTTMEIRTSILRDMASLLGNDEAMLKLQRYIRSLKREVKIEQDTTKQLAKKELKEDLCEALNELKEVQEGKAQLKSMKDLYLELESEQ